MQRNNCVPNDYKHICQMLGLNVNSIAGKI